MLSFEEEDQVGGDHLEVVEVLELGDGGRQHALAEEARHQLPSHPSHLICALHTLQFICLGKAAGYFVEIIKF